jgi:uncharacterized protein DUF1559
VRIGAKVLVVIAIVGSAATLGSAATRTAAPTRIVVRGVKGFSVPVPSAGNITVSTVTLRASKPIPSTFTPKLVVGGKTKPSGVVVAGGIARDPKNARLLRATVVVVRRGTARTLAARSVIGPGGPVVVILPALLLPAVQKVREAAVRLQARNNLKQLAIAAHNFSDVAGANPLPPADASTCGNQPGAWVADASPGTTAQNALFIACGSLYNQAWMGGEGLRFLSANGIFACFANFNVAPPGATTVAGDLNCNRPVDFLAVGINGQRGIGITDARVTYPPTGWQCPAGQGTPAARPCFGGASTGVGFTLTTTPRAIGLGDAGIVVDGDRNGALDSKVDYIADLDPVDVTGARTSLQQALAVIEHEPKARRFRKGIRNALDSLSRNDRNDAAYEVRRLRSLASTSNLPNAYFDAMDAAAKALGCYP